MICEKNFLAYRLDYDYSYIRLFSRELLAFGNDAYEYFERNPKDVEVFPCIENGKVTDLEEQALLIRHVMQKYKLNSGFTEPDGYLITTRTMTDFDRENNLKCLELRHRRCIFMEDIVLSMPEIRDLKGAVVVMIGHESSYLMAVSGGELLFVKRIGFSMKRLDETIRQRIRHRMKISISTKTAGMVRNSIGLLNPSRKELLIPAVELSAGLPVEFRMKESVVRDIYEEFILQLIADIRQLLKRLPYETVREVLKQPMFFGGHLPDDESLMVLVARRFHMEYRILDVDSYIHGIDREMIVNWSKEYEKRV